MPDEVFPDELPEKDPIDEMELPDLAAEYAREALKEMRERPKIGTAFSILRPARRDVEYEVYLQRLDHAYSSDINKLLKDGFVPNPMLGGTVQIHDGYLLFIGAREKEVKEDA
jgi:hypothetical protein